MPERAKDSGRPIRLRSRGSSSRRHASQRDCTRASFMQTVSPSRAIAAMHSGGATWTCSSRSPARTPAASYAASANTSSTRVTTWIAAFRPRACAARIVSTTSSRSGSSASARWIFTGPISMPAGGATSDSASVPITITRCDSSPRARAAANAATSAGPFVAVASVTAVTPSARRRRETSREARRRDRTEPLAEPRIGAVDAARRAPCPVALDAARRLRVAIEAEPFDRERVQDPELAAAVLHADRDVGAQRIERQRDPARRRPTRGSRRRAPSRVRRARARAMRARGRRSRARRPVRSARTRAQRPSRRDGCGGRARSAVASSLSALRSYHAASRARAAPRRALPTNGASG